MTKNDLQNLKRVLDEFNPYLAIKFAESLNNEERQYDEIILALQHILLDKFNTEYIVRFVNNVKGVNLELIQSSIINNDDPEPIYTFALLVKKANIEKLQQAIIESGDDDYIYLFAKNVNGANIKVLQEVIIDSKNVRCMFLFAKSVEGADIEKLQDVIISYGIFEYIYLFAKNVNGANMELLRSSVPESNNDAFMNTFDSISESEEDTSSNMYHITNNNINNIDSIGVKREFKIEVKESEITNILDDFKMVKIMRM